MKNHVITISSGILVFYIAYYGTVRIYSDIVGLLVMLNNESAEQIFKEGKYRDIAPFVRLMVPTFLCAFYTSLVDMQRETKNAMYIAIGSVVILFLWLSKFLTAILVIRWIDIFAFILTIPSAWFGVYLAQLLPNKSFKPTPKSGGNLP